MTALSAVDVEFERRSTRSWPWPARQHGVVTRSQLREAGLSPDVIDRRLARGLLRVLCRGVYAVANPCPAAPGRWHAAVLAGRAGAALSYHAAGGLIRLISYSGRAHVTVPKPRRPVRGIVWHTSVLAVDEIERRLGIPVTTPARTLLDLASCLDRHRLERAIDRAEGLGLSSPTSLSALVARYPGRRGVGTLREILGGEEIARGVTKSDLEDLFLAFIARLGLPRPETNIWMEIGGRMIEADCLWPEARLIVELDSRAWHDTTGAFEADRARDRAAVAAGWRVIRVTWRQITREPAALAADLRMALR